MPMMPLSSPMMVCGDTGSLCLYDPTIYLDRMSSLADSNTCVLIGQTIHQSEVTWRRGLKIAPSFGSPVEIATPGRWDEKKSSLSILDLKDKELTCIKEYLLSCPDPVLPVPTNH